jgi:hypothetical protein
MEINEEHMGKKVSVEDSYRLKKKKRISERNHPKIDFHKQGEAIPAPTNKRLVN